MAHRVNGPQKIGTNLTDRKGRKLSKRFDPAALRRIVIKLGSSTIIQPDGVVRLGFLGKLATTIYRLHQRDLQVVLVSSGAVALGRKKLGMEKRPVHIEDKQACAAAGQMELMSLYQNMLSTLALQTGQVLLTRDDLEDRRRYLNARETLNRLLELGVVPIINENDSVSVDEIQFGDNDELSALVSGLVDADLLVLLTNVNGLYDSNPETNPDAKLIETIDKTADEYFDCVDNRETQLGKGGMRTKLGAAQICRSFGIPCVIARGKGSVLEKVLKGEPAGSYVEPLPCRVCSRDRWLAKAAAVQGSVTLDAGAVDALTKHGKSLLPKGIVRVEGSFIRGAVLALLDEQGHEIGRGIARYNSRDLPRIIGKYGGEIESILGYSFGDCVIRQDDIAFTH